MKIAKSQLKQIIKEELSNILNENEADDMTWHNLVVRFNGIRVSDPEHPETERALNIYAECNGDKECLSHMFTSHPVADMGNKRPVVSSRALGPQKVLKK